MLQTNSILIRRISHSTGIWLPDFTLLRWVQVHPTGLVKPDDADAKVSFYRLSKAWHNQYARTASNDKASNEQIKNEILLVPPNIPIFIGFLWSLCHFVATFTGFLMHFELLKSDHYWYDWWCQKYCVFYLLIRWLVIRWRLGILNLVTGRICASLLNLVAYVHWRSLNIAHM